MSDHPVDLLDQLSFDVAAALADELLREFGYAFIDLQPGDGTTYKIVICQPREPGEVGFKLFAGEPVHGWRKTDRYWLGSSFGALYPWSPSSGNHWDYVDSHYLDKSHPWTARVLARFLSTLAERMNA